MTTEHNYKQFVEEYLCLSQLKGKPEAREEDLLNLKTEQNYKQFVEKYWCFSQLKGKTEASEVDLLNLERGQWYCNLTGKLIPELQKYNTVNDYKVTIQYTQEDEPEEQQNEDDEGNEESESKLSEQFYKKGYNTYHAYQCGHCYLDICVLSGLFDYINYPYSSMIDLKKKGPQAVNHYVENKLKNIYNQCMICGDDAKKTEFNRLLIYNLCTDLDCGTIISRCVIPHNRLGAICHELTPGDVIDTGGYRGLSLYIYEGNKTFTKVQTEEYFPIWPIEWLKRRGYLYYLTEAPETCYDALPFGNNVQLINGCHGPAEICFIEKEANCDELDYLNEEINVENNESTSQIKLGNFIVVVTKNTQGDYFELPYPFDNPKQANTLLLSGLTFKAKLTDTEYLLFRDRQVFITNDSIEHNVADF